MTMWHSRKTWALSSFLFILSLCFGIAGIHLIESWIKVRKLAFRLTLTTCQTMQGAFREAKTSNNGTRKPRWNYSVSKQPQSCTNVNTVQCEITRGINLKFKNPLTFLRQYSNHHNPCVPPKNPENTNKFRAGFDPCGKFAHFFFLYPSSFRFKNDKQTILYQKLVDESVFDSSENYPGCRKPDFSTIIG